LRQLQAFLKICVSAFGCFPSKTGTHSSLCRSFQTLDVHEVYPRPISGSAVCDFTARRHDRSLSSCHPLDCRADDGARPAASVVFPPSIRSRNSLDRKKGETLAENRNRKAKSRSARGRFPPDGDRSLLSGRLPAAGSSRACFRRFCPSRIWRSRIQNVVSMARRFLRISGFCFSVSRTRLAASKVCRNAGSSGSFISRK